MAFVFENKDRRVIPNWRSFNYTSNMGEIDPTSINANREFYPITEYIEDWKNNRTLVFAGDLMSAAISNNQTDNINVLEAASFVKSNRDKASKAQNYLADKLMESSENKYVSKVITRLEDISFDCIETVDHIHKRIAYIRQEINHFPYNPILYVEMARAYISIGLDKQAQKAMDIALYLSSDNRFVTRSAARLYIHLNDLDHAHYILRRNQSLKYDPWLIASEISVNQLRNKSSNNIKRGLEIINSNNFHPFSTTELSSSIGTVELINGANKKSRNLFNQSLLCPNDNSLAQAEWALIHKLPIFINREKFANIKGDFEAKALFSLQNQKFEEALGYTVDWICDMQFTRRPILIGSHIAYTHLKSYKIAAKILKIGLASNPNDSLILNNLAYTYALDNDVINAEKCIDQIDKIEKNQIENSTKICIIATKGLIAFRNKEYEKGRFLYKKAIDGAFLLRNETPTYYWKAILNYIREELLITTKYDEGLMNELDKIKERASDTEITALKNDIIELNKQRLTGIVPHN